MNTSGFPLLANIYRKTGLSSRTLGKANLVKKTDSLPEAATPNEHAWLCRTVFLVETLLFLHCVDFVVHPIFHVFHFVGNVVAGIVGMVAGGFVGGIFYIAPGLFGRAFYLIGEAAVRQVLISNCFADTLFHFTGSLVDFSGYLIFIHGSFLLKECVWSSPDGAGSDGDGEWRESSSVFRDPRRKAAFTGLCAGRR